MNKSGAILLVSIAFLVSFIFISSHQPESSTPVPTPVPPTWKAVEFIQNTAIGSTVYQADTYIACPTLVRIRTATIYFDKKYSVYEETLYTLVSGTWIRLINGKGEPVLYACPHYSITTTFSNYIYLLLVNSKTYTPIGIDTKSNTAITYTDSSGRTTTLVIYNS